MTQSHGWREAVEALLFKKYGITIDDVGLSGDEVLLFSDDYPKSEEFVEWFARKYDLTSRKEIGLRS